MGQSRYNRYERQQIHAKKLADSLKGTGEYVFKNASQYGTLHLPKLPIGRTTKVIGPNEEFHGDSYFLNMVRTHELRLVKCISQGDVNSPAAPALPAPAVPAKVAGPEKPVAMSMKNEVEDRVLTEAEDRSPKNRQPTRKAETVTPKTQKKLVLDQPDRVTTEGKVEHVVREENAKLLKEEGKAKPDVLINENPVGEIIIE